VSCDYNNSDQALTETIERWGKSFAELYSNVTKPLLDIVLFSLRLSELVGPQGPASVILYYACMYPSH
jgi:ATP-binding cassette subfamily D (ALD) protein 3